MKRPLLLLLCGLALSSAASARHPAPTEGPIPESRFRSALHEPHSLVALDSDSMRRAETRRMIFASRLPEPGTVRVEEFVNAFAYDDGDAPEASRPLTLAAEAGPCPWAAGRRLVRITVRSGTGIAGARMQVEFNPALVASYRLVGCEPAQPAAGNPDDGREGGGRIGPGEMLTVLYEVIPLTSGERPTGSDDALRYQNRDGCPVVTIPSSELLAVKVRYGDSGAECGSMQRIECIDRGDTCLEGDFAFAAAVAMYGQLLRESDFAGDATWDGIIELASRGTGADPTGIRRAFVDRVRVTRP